MFRLLPILLFIALIFFGFNWLKRQPPGKKRRAILQALVAVSMALLIFLVITGRIHWLGAALAALIPLAKFGLGLVAQVLPFLKHRSSQSPSPAPAAMTPDEAAETLGLHQAFRDNNLNKEVVLKAHKSLMQKVHPDRGGNDYLAARVNQAKDILLKNL
ncbi:molecular chaperone DnaJ [Gilvimarinus sp. SDUM040013]|uniref:Molecular chaperone DnaJ n=1 Tax=Gilvimarinus gilvus TaxID=3058038 RepID=A0ABU4S2C5_9GAMM|nr:molecular chaperone DnaJ [Gilvimarinus sp. SDUM040013]MDO3385744.1 molecular chaperone DnaJ [Gilvimarinus sp. SDUM040013]MDX6849384.1 molecular chaperone DnaJ [Gilvimarinus sp. SDUM040013]